MPSRQGLLHSPTCGTYPPWLVWGTSCPVGFLFLLLIAMQEIQGGIVVAVQFGPTVLTRMPALREVFLDDAATAGTLLRALLGGNFHDLATSLFRFVATERDKLPPGCI